MNTVRLLATSALVMAICAAAQAASVPLPRPRPADSGTAAPALEALLADPDLARLPDPDPPALMSDCQARIGAEAIAVFESVPAIHGPGGCGAPDVVRLNGILLPGGGRVALSPPATLRCGMAEQVSRFVREALAPALAPSGGEIRALDNYASYHCRTRNNIRGARISEHGYGNAIDIRGVRLTDGRFVDFTDRTVARDLRETIRTEACARFRTVLGPASDGYHEDHIHLDLAQRARDYRLCQWAVLDPVPLPRPRPPEAPGPDAAVKSSEDGKGTGESGKAE